MQILTVDIGTGTQDILLFDSRADARELPEAGHALAHAACSASRSSRGHGARQPLLITGVLMGGGPVSWAVEAHHRAGLPVFATAGRRPHLQRRSGRGAAPSWASRSSTRRRPRRLRSASGYAHVEFRRLRLSRPSAPHLPQFGLDLRPDALALAVFDHGAAPPRRQRPAVSHGLPGRPAPRGTAA